MRPEFCRSMVFLLLLAGCEGLSLPPSPPKGIEVVRAFEPASVAADPSLAENPAGEPGILLYVDNSASMKGFVAPPASAYRSALDFLLDRTTSANYGFRIHRFAEQVDPLGNTSVAAVLDPSFYSGSATSFPDLFQHIGEECGPDDVAVVVSDFVQSGKTGDQRALVQAFQKLAKERRSILLLAFRSAFEGRYFVEARRSQSKSFTLNFDGRTPEQSRPFYMLLIAGSPSALIELQELLLPDIAPDAIYEASSPALPVQSVEFIPPNPEVPVWNTYRPAERLAARSGAPADVLSFLEVALPSSEATPLRLRLGCPGECATSPVRSPERLSLEITRRSLRSGKWSSPDALDDRPLSLYSRDGKGITLDYRFPRPAPLSWDVYRVRVRPGTGNLNAPQWVEEWSTPDDGTPRLGHQTYKLDLFVEAMIRSIQEQVPLSEHYILLGRGER